ncbi:hypothetical protein BD289DRAFT_343854, partial [Coniella lustricola]
SLPASQQSLASTEPPASPADPAESFKTERNDDRPASAGSVVPSSLTPPPSSQVPSNNNASRTAANAMRQRMLSPPGTGHNPLRPEPAPAGVYTAPRPDQVVVAAPEELRAMLQACIGEQSRLKMEAAHHKLQYQLLSVRAQEDAHRAAVEQELTMRQLEALRQQRAEPPRPPRRAISSSPEITQTMYDSIKVSCEKSHRDNDKLRRDHTEACKRLKAAKKLIMRQEEDMDSLRQENKLLRERLHDKRELWEKLASPGGIFHTPKPVPVSPAQHRQTPRQTPKHRVDRQAQPFDVLLQAATQENSSAPSTPMTPGRAAGRQGQKHARGAQSMSSLPSTPNRSRQRGSDLLPPPDLVPQTEPPRRFGAHTLVLGTPVKDSGFDHEEPVEKGRHSRESTISADETEVLVRAALQSVAQQATSFASRGSPPARARVPLPSHRGHQSQTHSHSQREEESQVYESQASQEATSMLRRDPRESFEVASSHNSRDVTPTSVLTTADKRLQSTLRGPVNKPTPLPSGKRKLDATEQSREPSSPTKRLRLAGGLREGNPPVGLGLGFRG